jgi:hypothetical protein
MKLLENAGIKSLRTINTSLIDSKTSDSIIKLPSLQEIFEAECIESRKRQNESGLNSL